MSARYSSSPALHLLIGDSRFAKRLHRALCLAMACSLLLLACSGHSWLALSLLFPVAGLLWRWRSPSPIGVRLRWRQGLWSLERPGDQHSIFPGRRSVALPWLVYFDYRDWPGGPRRHLWVFADATERGQFRRLCVRLVLQRGERRGRP